MNKSIQATSTLTKTTTWIKEYIRDDVKLKTSIPLIFVYIYWWGKVNIENKNRNHLLALGIRIQSCPKDGIQMDLIGKSSPYSHE